MASRPAARQALESASVPRRGRTSARGRSTTATPWGGLFLDRGLTGLIYSALFVYLIYPYSDFDWGWHYRYGEYFFTHHQILRHDIFSWTMPGYEWVNHSWLYDLVLYVLCVNSKRPPLDNPLVKQALSLAIDRERIVKELWKGRGIVPNGPIAKGTTTTINASPPSPTIPPRPKNG